MKTSSFSIILFVIIIFLGFGIGSAHADNTNGVYIQDIQVQPSSVKVGETFTVSATLTNNSTFPIYADGGKCSVQDTQAELFTITLDSHAKNKLENIFCAGVGWSQLLDSGKSITLSNPDYTDTYVATEPGIATITVKFSYHSIIQKDPIQTSDEQTISKSFQFQVHDINSDSSGPPIPMLGTLLPLQQFKSGIAANDVKCEQGLQLVIKAEDGSPACVKHDTATKLITRGGWSKVIPSIENTNLNTLSENGCGQFYTAPRNQDNKKIPVLLMNSNSTGCTRLTFTIIYNYHDTPWPRIANFPPLGIVGNTNHVTHGDTFSVTPGKDFTNSFQITVMPQTVDLANYPIGSNFTVTYVIKPLPNATGFYDHSIPKLACERYPLAVGYAANQVNYSDFSYIDPLNPPCVSGPYELTAVEISGMNYKQVELGSHP